MAVLTSGLPNITGSGYDFIENKNDDIEKMGAGTKGAIMLKLSSVKRLSSFYASSSMTFGSNYGELGIDASRSARIYGKSETVQPAALSATPQIKY